MLWNLIGSQHFADYLTWRTLRDIYAGKIALKQLQGHSVLQ